MRDKWARGILSFTGMALSHDAQRNRDAWDGFIDEYQTAHASQLNDHACVWGCGTCGKMSFTFSAALLAKTYWSLAAAQ